MRDTAPASSTQYLCPVHLTTHAEDSALGRWTHTEWRPPHLAHVLERLWHFEGRPTALRERTFPGGYLELILQLGDRYRDVAADGSATDPFPHACIGGQQTEPLVILAPARPTCVLGVRLRPVGAYALLARPLHEATNLTLDLGDMADRAAAELAERCAGERTVAARFAVVEQWVTSRLARLPGAHPGVAWAAAQLEATHGTAAIAALRDQAGLSAARFATTFREQVGLGPKQYARVLRFRHALGLLQRGGRLSDVALTAGYYDQPHMNADFREFARLTPAAFVASPRFPNSPSLAEPG